MIKVNTNLITLFFILFYQLNSLKIDALKGLPPAGGLITPGKGSPVRQLAEGKANLQDNRQRSKLGKSVAQQSEGTAPQIKKALKQNILKSIIYLRYYW